MKTSAYLFAAATLAYLIAQPGMAFAQTPAKFTANNLSLGKIQQNKPASLEFSFVNTGAKPLVIDVATPDCSCLSVGYPKEAFPNGKGGKVRVSFNAAAPGAFSKTVTVKFANVADPAILIVSGEVIPASVVKR